MLGKIAWGIHPNTHKEATEKQPIESGGLPDKVVLPVSQHIGAPGEPIVKKGETVKKGQIIAKATTSLSSNVHASISGKIASIKEETHPVMGRCTAITITSDGLDEWAEGLPLNRDWEDFSNAEIVEIIKEAGIVGLGGATFPTHVKVTPPEGSKVHTLIINGAECEPYLTADHRLMLEYGERLLIGVLILKRILSADKAIIGIEDNKMDAVIKLTEAAAGKPVKVMAVPTRYPHGSEKMLIKTILKKELPSGRLPVSLGVVVQNVGTAVAVCDAVRNGIPLIERVVTVSGSAIAEPKNLCVRIGTSFDNAISLCGGLKSVPGKIIMGGPFMGIAQHTTDIPIIKGTNGILAFTSEEIHDGPEEACIHCGECIDACPLRLNPSMLSILGQRGLVSEAAEKYRLYDCMECGSCTYVCPAKRRIVQYIRYCKKMASQKGGK